jgi:hypothetical protein
MVERYIKTVEEHLRKVVASHQKNWDERVLFLLLAYHVYSRGYELECSPPSVRARTLSAL